MISGPSNVIFFWDCLSDSRLVVPDPLGVLGVRILDAPWIPSVHAAIVGGGDFQTRRARNPTCVLFEEIALVSYPYPLIVISPAVYVVSLNLAVVIDSTSNQNGV